MSDHAETPVDNDVSAEPPANDSEAWTPLFSPPETARSLSAGAFVLAGFCFASIVLLITLEASNPGLIDERPVAALVTAFLGCVVSGFLMALLVGEISASSHRCFWLALLGSVTLASSCLLALWGVADLVGLVFSTSGDLTGLVRAVFFVAGVLAFCFVSNTAVDLLRVVTKGKANWILLVLPVGAQVLAVVGGYFAAWGASADTSIYLIAKVELSALTTAVGVAVYLATYGKPHHWGRVPAIAATCLLVPVPTLLTTILIFMLR